MSRPIQYLIVVVLGSTSFGAWILHHDTGSGTTEAVVNPSRRTKVEIERVPAVTQPSPATTQPATQPAPGLTLPPEFAIFQTRNAFAHGKSAGGAGPSGPEAGFILRGVVQAEDRLIAFVEDKSASRVTEITAGQLIARGKITAVTIDGVEYQGGGGAAKQIKVGQDLNGQVAPPAPTSKPVGPQPGPGEGPAPGNEIQPGPPADQPMPVQPGKRQRILKAG